MEVENLPDELPGIIAALGELGLGAIITEGGMAHLFKRHLASIKRAVLRGEQIVAILECAQKSRPSAREAGLLKSSMAGTSRSNS